MSLFNKVVSGISKGASEITGNSVKSPTRRICGGGWQVMGPHTKAPDTRTTEQLLDNIDYFAQRNPEVAKFQQELKEMNPKHLGLVSDICELANSTEMLGTSLDIKDPRLVGKNVFATWMEKLPKASKENPEAVELAKEVINQTDDTASKYFLAAYNGILDHPEAARHMSATRPLVKDIAESTLAGSYTMDFSKEQKFINALNGYISPTADVEKIELMPNMLKTAGSIPGDADIRIEAFPFIQSKVPMSKIKENLEVFPQVAEESLRQGKDINMTDFLMYNTNLD